MESRREMETAMERLSSGKRINTAGDDAAGLAISQRMESQIRGLNMAIRNANDAISLTATAEGAMGEVSDMLQRMRELSLQAVNGVNNDADRASLDAEVQALKSEIDRVAGSTTFNNQTILDGSYARTFQIGYNNQDTFDISLASISTNALGLFASGTQGEEATAAFISARTSLGSAIDAGDIVIDDQEVGAISASADIKDVVDIINRDVDTVRASAFNAVVAKQAGSGVVGDNEVAIRVGAIGASGDPDYQAPMIVQLGPSNSMSELVANINAAFGGGQVVASTTSDGKLMLSNDTGATISIVDESGTDLAYDGGTGFLSDTDAIGGAGATGNTAAGASASIAFASGLSVAGFLKLESTDGTQITIDRGNKHASVVGSSADMAALGFIRILEDPQGSNNQVIGNNLTSAGVSTAFDKSALGVADVIINGVEIYDATLSPLSNTFQGKLDLINAFSDETNVIASAYLEKTYDMSDTVFIATDEVEINGVNVAYGADLATFMANINLVTDETGIVATTAGQNLTLVGEGVQNLNIRQRSFDLAAASTATVQAAARRDTDLADSAQSVTIGSSLVQAGRIFQLSVGAQAAGAQFTAAAETYTFTATAAHSAADIVIGFRNLMHLELIEDGAATSVPGNLISASASTLVIAASAGLGSASITLSVVALSANKAAFDVGEGASSNVYGAIRLSSSDNGPISIELGEGDDASAHGLAEMNVGDTTYDTNSPTHAVLVESDRAVQGLNIATSDAATDAISVIDGALEAVAQYRAGLGAIENRMLHTVDNLSNVVENTSAARSRIEDADFAAEAAALARAQILQQAGTAMLAQANAAPQNVLSLLG
jgi:flagellin